MSNIYTNLSYCIDICNLEILFHEDLYFLKIEKKVVNIVKNTQQNYSKEEPKTLTSLTKKECIIIQKSGKGNYVSCIEKENFIKRMGNLLTNQIKIERLTLKK